MKIFKTQVGQGIFRQVRYWNLKISKSVIYWPFGVIWSFLTRKSGIFWNFGILKSFWVNLKCSILRCRFSFHQVFLVVDLFYRIINNFYENFQNQGGTRYLQARTISKLSKSEKVTYIDHLAFWGVRGLGV